jgi:hypothetical protein
VKVASKSYDDDSGTHGSDDTEEARDDDAEADDSE